MFFPYSHGDISKHTLSLSTNKGEALRISSRGPSRPLTLVLGTEGGEVCSIINPPPVLWKCFTDRGREPSDRAVVGSPVPGGDRAVWGVQ